MIKYREDFWKLADKLFDTHKIVIDRPKGSRHPKYTSYIYPLDYGYLEDTSSGDNAGIDVWIGTSKQHKVSAVISSIDILKGDSEIKLLYACTMEEIKLIYDEHNRTDNMKGLLNIRRDPSVLAR